MSAPICHRTRGSATPYTGYEAAYRGEPCIGSRCALWAPASGGGSGEPMPDGGDTAPLTGKGWCADNLCRPPWADPSAPVDPEPPAASPPIGADDSDCSGPF